MKSKVLAKMNGFGLIEVLVTMLLLSTALLTLTSLQTRALQFNQGAYFRSQANLLGYDMLDRIRVNTVGNLDNYDLATMAFPGNIDTATTATRDQTTWLRDIQDRLPSGTGAIDCNANRVCAVTITWNELNASGNVLEDQSVFTYAAQM